jgi:hypothetical protein
MAGKPRLPLVLTDAERRTLQGWASRRKTAQGLAQRARIVLMCADGKTNIAVAADPNPEANTIIRYQTETCADQRGGSGINEPRPRPRGDG